MSAINVQVETSRRIPEWLTHALALAEGTAPDRKPGAVLIFRKNQGQDLVVMSKRSYDLICAGYERIIAGRIEA